MKARCWAVALGLSTLCASSLASAEVQSATRTREGDNYIFRDDLLSSDVRFPRGGSIRVRPPALRVMLIRPRASFVTEMFKSVEHI